MASSRMEKMIKLLCILSEIPSSVELRKVAKQINLTVKETIEVLKPLYAYRLVNMHIETGLCTGLYELKDISVERFLATDPDLYRYCERVGLLPGLKGVTVEDLACPSICHKELPVRALLDTIKDLIAKK